MRILVCGGRDFGHVVRTKANTDDEPPEVQVKLLEYKYIQEELNKIINKVSIFYDPANNWLPFDIVIIHGGARGADSAASDFADVSYCQQQCFPADWKKYGTRAGYIRNQQMLDEGKPDFVVAFPGGPGTAMMVKIAEQAGIKVINKMGTKGSFLLDNEDNGYWEPSPKTFKTQKYQQLYFDRIAELKLTTPGQKQGIFGEFLTQEEEFLKNMGNEYDEIMQAQDVVDKLG